MCRIHPALRKNKEGNAGSWVSEVEESINRYEGRGQGCRNVSQSLGSVCRLLFSHSLTEIYDHSYSSLILSLPHSFIHPTCLSVYNIPGSSGASVSLAFCGGTCTSISHKAGVLSGARGSLWRILVTGAWAPPLQQFHLSIFHSHSWAKTKTHMFFY